MLVRTVSAAVHVRRMFAHHETLAESQHSSTSLSYGAAQSSLGIMCLNVAEMNRFGLEPGLCLSLSLTHTNTHIYFDICEDTH